MQNINRRSLLGFSAAAALTRVVLPTAGITAVFTQPAKAFDPITIYGFVEALNYLRLAFGVFDYLVNEGERQKNMQTLSDNLITLENQQDKIMAELSKINVVLREELKRGFQERDMMAFRALTNSFARKLEGGGFTKEWLEESTSEANRLAYKIGSYDFAVFPQYMGVVALQVVLNFMNGVTPQQMKQIGQANLDCVKRWNGLEDYARPLFMSTVENDGRYIVHEVEEGSSAEKAGLRVGMLVTKIDGHPVHGMKIPEYHAHMYGKAGTEVVITTDSGYFNIMREMDEEYNITPAMFEHIGPISINAQIKSIQYQINPITDYINSVTNHEYPIAKHVTSRLVNGQQVISGSLMGAEFLGIDESGEPLFKLWEKEVSAVSHFNETDYSYRQIADAQGLNTGCVKSDPDSYYRGPVKSETQEFVQYKVDCMKEHFREKDNIRKGLESQIDILKKLQDAIIATNDFWIGVRSKMDFLASEGMGNKPLTQCQDDYCVPTPLTP